MRARTENALCTRTLSIGRYTTRRQRRRSYRNPKDRFFLVAGKRPDGYKVNNAATGAESRSRRLSSKNRRSANRRTFKRSNCRDVLPPASDGVYYSCAQQKEWDKCDSPFMTNGKYCDKTCARCIDIFEDLRDDYDDYEETVPDVSVDRPAPAPGPSPYVSVNKLASAPGPSPHDEMDEDNTEDALITSIDFDGMGDNVLTDLA